MEAMNPNNEIHPLLIPAAPSPKRAAPAILTALALAALGAYALIRLAPAHPLLLLTAIPIYAGAGTIAALGLKPVKPTLDRAKESAPKQTLSTVGDLARLEDDQLQALVQNVQREIEARRRLTVKLIGVSPETGREEWPGLDGSEAPTKAKTVEDYWRRVAQMPQQVVIEAPEELKGIFTGTTEEELAKLQHKDFLRQNYSFECSSGILNVTGARLKALGDQSMSLLERFLRLVVPNHKDSDELLKSAVTIMQQRSTGDLIGAAIAAYGSPLNVNLAPISQGPWCVQSSADRSAPIYSRTFTLQVSPFDNPQKSISSPFTATVEYNIQSGMTTYTVNRPERLESRDFA